MASPWGLSQLPQPFVQQAYPFVQGWGGIPPHMQPFASPTPLSPSPAGCHTPQHIIPQVNLMTGDTTVEVWCRKYGLGDEECQSLTKLGFKVGDKLDSLSMDIWEWAKVPPLRRLRILDAYATSVAGLR